MSNSELSCSDSSFFSSSLSFSVNGGLFLEPAVSNNSFFRWVSPAAEQSFGKGSSVSSLSNLCRFKAVGVGGGRFFLVSLTSDGIVRETKRCLVQNGYEDAVVEERKKKNKKIRVRKGAAVNTTKHLWAGTIVAMVSRQQKLNHLEGLMAILGMMRPNILEFEVSNLHTRKQSGLFVLCTTRTAYFNFRVGERITKVSGHVGIVPGATTTTPVVRSITFTTNENIYGPYGVEEGELFEANIPIGAHISGFFGRTSDDYLNAIGFYQATKVEPFGGPDGNPWDDEAEHTGVRGIKLTYKEAVGSFRAVYDSNGNPDLGPGHPSGDFSYRPGDAYFNFRVGERITKVSGHVGIVPGATTTTPVVRSITFTTNENIYGPYGVEEGEPFEANIPPGAYISRFFGRTSSDYLNAIRFYKSKHDGVQGINVISNGGVVNIVNVTYNLKGAVPEKFLSSGGSNLTATVGNVTFTSTSTVAG